MKTTLTIDMSKAISEVKRDSLISCVLQLVITNVWHSIELMDNHSESVIPTWSLYESYGE